MTASWRIILGAALMVSATVAVAGPAAMTRAVSGTSGKDIRIGMLTNVHKDCLSGPLPVVRLVKGPEHGSVHVRRARATLTNTKNCLATQVPAYLVFYKSYPNFVGNDTVELEVKNLDTGVLQLEEITVTVTEPGLRA